MDEQQTPPEALTQPQGETTPLERLWALKLLRENMFYADPSKYSLTDIAEDLPGDLKPVGHILGNVLPSAAIISSDPVKRKAQIDAAINKIKNTKKSDKDLHKEMIDNAISMGKGTIIPGALLSLATGKFGLRLPWAKNFVRDAAASGGWRSTGRSLRSPLNFTKLKVLFGGGKSGRLARKMLLNETLHNTASNIGLAAATGAIYPYLANKTQVSDKALDEARRVMEQQPYLTSLPASEILSVLNKNKENAPGSGGNTFRNVAIGAGVGAASGAISGALPSAATALLSLLTLGKVSPKGGLGSAKFLTNAAQGIKSNAKFGGGLGILSGLASKDIINDEYQHVKDQTTPSSENIPEEKPVSALAAYRNEYKKPISYTI